MRFHPRRTSSEIHCKRCGRSVKCSHPEQKQALFTQQPPAVLRVCTHNKQAFSRRKTMASIDTSRERMYGVSTLACVILLLLSLMSF